MNLVKLQDTKLIHRNLFHTKDQKEIKETIPFTIATKKMKCLGINLPREKKDLYAENYKILMKETKDDTNRWKNISYSWTGRSNIVKKLTVLPPKIHRFSAIPVKLPMALFTELRQKNLIIFMEMQNSLGNQSNLETEKQSGRNQAP